MAEQAYLAKYPAFAPTPQSSALASSKHWRPSTKTRVYRSALALLQCNQKIVNIHTLMTEDEVDALRLMNLGKMSSRARAGTTQESKDKCIAATLKAAGVTATTETRQEEEDEVKDTPHLEAQGTNSEAEDHIDET